MTHYPMLLKDWRKRRRMSQLDLALAADVSARHISFLETGRARPSPDMIIHLSDVLEVPTDGCNQMLQAVGFVPRYATTPLDDDAMAPVRQAVAWTLDRHAPYPGLAMDRLWRLVALNGPAAQLFAPFGISEGDNMLDLILSPAMPQVVENWGDVAYYTMLRLRAESSKAGGIAELDRAVEALKPQAEVPESTKPAPTIPTVYTFGGERLALFGTIAQFSTVNDETLDDLKVELFFPADAESAALLTALEAKSL